MHRKTGSWQRDTLNTATYLYMYQKINKLVFISVLAVFLAVLFEHSNRTILKTSRLTRACHRPFNALSLSDAPLKDAPNLHCLSLSWDRNGLDVFNSPQLLHFQHGDKSKTSRIYPRLTCTLTSYSTGQAEDV